MRDGVIYEPRDREELCELLRTRDERQTVRICGTEPKQAADVTIVMRGLDRMVLYEPDEMIVQCEAGMKLTDLAETLAAHAQWIPTLVPKECSSTTIGGALALDEPHPRARASMSLRTTVLGGTFATMRGEQFRSGSRVVKSVAGYDTHRAFVGSCGRFGPILEVTLRVLPRPERFLRFRALASELTALRQLHPSILEVTGSGLVVEISGFEEDVAADQMWLRERGIDVAELADEPWYAALNECRVQSSGTESHMGDNDLLDRLRHVFDPGGQLR